ncbi:uncharacterized protein B0P05DRAFT_569591 [Gilbertella persicaria]|uniref:uncharacterized protein n=1 Tax=Gilbertella persicaria TaxID=101096 RepID=UPI0022211D82|nr:uncharacterized protein B0P05DRAFT_569591 [Gilbertella persicaria]KAI8087643.1 hypothetical protein B0P05DRAFT_569591 [Gilbertella persicaria]
MDTLIASASKELTQQLSVENLTMSTTAQLDTQLTSCQQRIHHTHDTLRQVSTRFIKAISSCSKMQQGIEDTNTVLQALKERDQALKATFDKIDQLESIIDRVKETYHQVANNVDKIEKAVSASTPFRLSQKNTPVQPYFPPPNPVDMFDTHTLFKEDP